MTRFVLVASLAAGLLYTLPAASQFQKPEDAIKYRQSAFTVMSSHLGRVGAMAAGRTPFDAKAAADNTAIVLAMSKLPFVAFAPGTDKGLPNRAKPEVWSDSVKYTSLVEKMQAEVTKLDAAAKSGSLDAIKGAMGGVGASCKACHDDYRAEKYSAN